MRLAAKLGPQWRFHVNARNSSRRVTFRGEIATIGDTVTACTHELAACDCLSGIENSPRVVYCCNNTALPASYMQTVPENCLFFLQVYRTDSREVEGTIDLDGYGSVGFTRSEDIVTFSPGSMLYASWRHSDLEMSLYRGAKLPVGDHLLDVHRVEVDDREPWIVACGYLDPEQPMVSLTTAELARIDAILTGGLGTSPSAEEYLRTVRAVSAYLSSVGKSLALPGVHRIVERRLRVIQPVRSRAARAAVRASVASTTDYTEALTWAVSALVSICLFLIMAMFRAPSWLRGILLVVLGAPVLVIVAAIAVIATRVGPGLLWRVARTWMLSHRPDVGGVRGWLASHVPGLAWCG